MVYTKELLHREIEAYLQHINFAYNCYEAYNELHNVNEINNELLNISAGFFTITRFALSKCLLVETAKLFCGSGDERTMSKLINVAKSNNKIFKLNVLPVCEKASNEITGDFANTIMKIKSRRDQDLSHNDPLFFYGDINPAEQHYISPQEIEDILLFSFDFCADLLDSLSIDKRVVLSRGSDDLGDLIKLIASHKR